MADFKNLEFLNVNSLRSYPLREGVSRQDAAQTMKIPDDFLVDFRIALTSDVTARVGISKILNAPDFVTVEISEINSSQVIGTFQIEVALHQPYAVYYSVAADAYAGHNAKLVVNSLSSLQNEPLGTFEFNPAEAEFETCTVIPSLVSVSRIVFSNADGSLFSRSGDVQLVAQTNTRFRQIAEQEVALDAADGLGLNSACEDVRPSIKTINNVPPDLNGNFWINTSDCAKLTSMVSGSRKGLLLSDLCCKPCLSCNEIGELTARVMQLESDLLTLRQNYSDVSLLSQQFATLSTADCQCD